MLQLCMVLAWHNQVIDLSVMRKHVNDPAWSAMFISQNSLINNEGFYGSHPRSIHIRTLHRSLELFEGSDLSWPTFISHTTHQYSDEVQINALSCLLIAYIRMNVTLDTRYVGHGHQAYILTGTCAMLSAADVRNTDIFCLASNCSRYVLPLFIIVVAVQRLCLILTHCNSTAKFLFVYCVTSNFHILTS